MIDFMLIINIYIYNKMTLKLLNILKESDGVIPFPFANKKTITRTSIKKIK